MAYLSFVIRLWQAEVDISRADSDFRGRIEHVQSGDVGAVTHMDDVAAFIQEHLSTAELEVGQGDQE